MGARMAQKKIFFLNVLFCSITFIYGCVSQDLRLPSSANEVYKNSDVQQSLMMAAQNNILFAISNESLNDYEKTEIDAKCKSTSNPFWAEKLTVYLNYMRQHPEWFSKFHVLEIKKGDHAQIQLQKDLVDGARVLSIQYVMSEVRGKVTFKTQLPCQGSLAEYIGQPLVKTDFDFPSKDQMEQVLAAAPDKEKIDRFDFSSAFLMYLAERGAIFKFSHEQSFEKINKKYVLATALNKLAQEIKKQNFGFVNLFLKKINQNSNQAEVIQLFGLVNDKELKAGLKVDSQTGDVDFIKSQQPSLTYLYLSYRTDTDDVVVAPLTGLNLCLQEQSKFLGSSLRKPADTSEKNSYLRPGFQCDSKVLIDNIQRVEPIQTSE